jgi:hypothetical protein
VGKWNGGMVEKFSGTPGASPPERVKNALKCDKANIDWPLVQVFQSVPLTPKCLTEGNEGNEDFLLGNQEGRKAGGVQRKQGSVCHSVRFWGSGLSFPRRSLF